MKWVGYQLRWLADPSVQKVGLKSRRIGFSEVVAFESATRACGVDLVRGINIKPVNQNFISASFPQAKELMAKAINHVVALGKAAPAGTLIDTESVTVVRLLNGAKLCAFSSNPRSIRGYEGDVNLDEFGNTANQDKVWAAAAPLAKPNLGAPLGYKIRVVGTPEGDANRFYRICKGNLAKRWSLHEVDVTKAVADGFPLMVQNAEGEYVPGTIEDLKEEIGDPDIFAQEYECSFLSASGRYISEDLWNSCVFHMEDRPPSFADSLVYAGMDIARKRHRSAIVRAERHRDTLWHIDTESERDMKWDDQEAWVDRKMQRCARMAVDATGLGSQFAERLQSRFGSRVEPIVFTGPIKEVLASGLKLSLERKRFRPRADDVDLRKSVLLMRRKVTEAGNIRFESDEDKDGHGDEGWAAALMVHAAGGAAVDHKMPSAGLVPRKTDAHAATGAVRRGGWR